MLRVVRPVARVIAEAANAALADYREGLIEFEPAFTERMNGAISYALRNFSAGGISWSAYSIKPGSGKSAEEKRHGADLMGVLNVHTDDYRVDKGFLAQAKRAEPGQLFDQQDWDRLQEQARKMLDRTPSSYVLIYSRSAGIRVVPALAVVSFRGRDIFDLYSSGVQRFFEEHLKCFIGDERLHSPSIDVLDTLEGLPVKHILNLKGTPT